jgi:hypothetical protein
MSCWLLDLSTTLWSPSRTVSTRWTWWPSRPMPTQAGAGNFHDGLARQSLSFGTPLSKIGASQRYFRQVRTSCVSALMLQFLARSWSSEFHAPFSFCHSFSLCCLRALSPPAIPLFQITCSLTCSSPSPPAPLFLPAVHLSLPVRHLSQLISLPVSAFIIV